MLLTVSYGLYAQWNVAYTLILLGVTAVTYLFALLIEAKEAYLRKRYMITCGATLTLLPLLVFKYYDFIIDTVNSLMASMHIATSMPGLNWVVPIGISFFTFQALGYLFDVYYGRIKAEHCWWDYMLFVCFFPQIMSGPISKAKDLLPQIKNARTFDAGFALKGIKWFVWGLFLKVVMADRLGLYVDEVLDYYTYQSGISCLAASVLYSFQIYGDFAGYSFMAMGVGRVMGFNLINNFQQPYLATSVTDFWRRWHISLSTWLKDYVYIPLGGNRCSKAQNYWNIFVTFLVSGIWHGANWTYILWGILHGIFQIAEKALGWQKCESRKPIVRILRILITFALVTFAWTIFRMPSIRDAFGVMERIFTDSGSLNILPKTNIVLCLLSVITVTCVDVLRELKPQTFYRALNAPTVRWSMLYALMVIILLCGVFDCSQFIYVSF